MARNTGICFRDLKQRDSDARNTINEDAQTLAQKAVPTDDEKASLKRLQGLQTRLKQAPKLEVADNLFVATRDALNQNPGLIGKQILNHTDGVLKATGLPVPAAPGLKLVAVQKAAAAAAAAGIDFPDVIRISLLLGLLSADAIAPPRLVWNQTPQQPNDPEIIADTSDQPAWANFCKAVYSAYGEVQAAFPLASLVLPILDAIGDPNGRGGRKGEVETREFALLMRCLQSKGVNASQPGQLERRINECLDQIQNVGDARPISEIGIALPNLNGPTGYDIQPRNVELIGNMICASMLEDLNAFRVVDKLAELWQDASIALSSGTAGNLLYAYWKETPNRMSEAERRNFYSMTLGVPGGKENGGTNRDFSDLWMRFVASVSQLVRQKSVELQFQSKFPMSVMQQQVKKAARDLALNLSRHGYGMSYYAAVELQQQIGSMIDLLGDVDIMRIYGARDMWQVIDAVSTLELGGPKNSSRYRTLATCGAIITKWLAQNIDRYTANSFVADVIDVNDVLSAYPHTAGPLATSKPTDYDLVNACELWRLETGTADTQTQEMSQPREAPTTTSLPIQIPQIARDMLEQAGVPSLGMAMQAQRH